MDNFPLGNYTLCHTLRNSTWKIYVVQLYQVEFILDIFTLDNSSSKFTLLMTNDKQISVWQILVNWLNFTLVHLILSNLYTNKTKNKKKLQIYPKRTFYRGAPWSACDILSGKRVCSYHVHSMRNFSIALLKHEQLLNYHVVYSVYSIVFLQSDFFFMVCGHFSVFTFNCAAQFSAVKGSTVNWITM